MTIVQYDIQASIMRHLEQKTGLRVIWIYDGVTLPDEKQKPFLTIEQMQDDITILAKQREAIETIYRFQVGLFARTAAERARLQESLRSIFLYDDFALLDTSQSGFPPVGVFNVTVERIVPIPADDLAQASEYHRVYFDIFVQNIETKE